MGSHVLRGTGHSPCSGVPRPEGVFLYSKVPCPREEGTGLAGDQCMVRSNAQWVMVTWVPPPSSTE